MSILDQALKNQPALPKPVTQEFGITTQFAGAFELGSYESIHKTGKAVLQKALARKKASESGENFLTKEEAIKTFGEDFEFKEGEYLEEADLRFQHNVESQISGRKAQGAGVVTSLTGGAVGNLLQPTDLVLSLVSPVALLSKAKGAYVGVKAGTVTAQVGKRLASVSAASLISKQARNAVVEQVGEGLTVAAGSAYTDRNYGVLDLVMDVGLGSTLNTAVATPAALKAAKQHKLITNVYADQAAMEQAFTAGNVSQISDILTRHSREYRQALAADPEIETIMSKPITDMSDMEQARARKFILDQGNEIWASSLKGIVPQDPNIPMVEAYQKKVATEIRIAEAKRKGTLEELSPEDLQYAKQADKRLDDYTTKLYAGLPTDLIARQLKKIDYSILGEAVSSRINKILDSLDEPKATKSIKEILNELEEANPEAAQKVSNEVDSVLDQIPKPLKDQVGPEAAQKNMAASAKSMEGELKQNLTKQMENAETEAQQVREKVHTARKSTSRSNEDLVKHNTAQVNKLMPENLRKLYEGEPEAKDGEAPKIELTKAEKRLATRLNPIRVRYDSAEAELDLGMFDNPESGFNNPKMFGEQLSKQYKIYQQLIETGQMTSLEAEADFRNYIQAQKSGDMLKELHNYSVAQDILSGAKKYRGKSRLKYFKSYIDGMNRKGINLQRSSVSNEVSAQITIGQSVLHEALTKHKMFDVFDNPDSTLINDLMYATSSNKIPEHWKGSQEAVFKDIWEAYKATNEALNAELNRYGGNIRELEGHTGVSQRWNATAMQAKGFEEWAKDMYENVDWERTRQLHGDVMRGKTDEKGFATSWEKFDRKEFLKRFWEDATTTKATHDHPAMNISRSFGHHRTMALKKEAEADMILKYSGQNSLGQLWLDQVRHKSEMVAIARTLGNNPIPNFRELVKEAGIEVEINNTRTKDTFGFGDLVHKLDVSTLDWSLSQVTGHLDSPVNADMGALGRGARQLSHVLFLWTSGISAINDLPLAVATLQELGVQNPTKVLTTNFKKALKRRFKGDDRAMKQWLTSNGANVDAILNASARYTGLTDNKAPGSLLTRMSNAMFTINGLRAWTGIMQEAFVDSFTQDLAKDISSGKINVDKLSAMRAAGISEAELLSLGKFIETDEVGVQRLGPSSLRDNPDLRRRMTGFIAKFRDQAVIMPDVSTQAMMRLGTRAGTPGGEGVRTIFQYQAFPLAMNRVAARRFLINSSGESPWTTQQVTLARTATFIGGMLALAYVSTVLKDTIRGREPMHFGNMTMRGWERIVNQSGMGGMMQTMLEVARGNTRAALSPLANTAYDITSVDSAGDLIHSTRAFQGANVPVIGPLFQKLIAQPMGDMLDELF